MGMSLKSWDRLYAIKTWKIGILQFIIDIEEQHLLNNYSQKINKSD